MKSKSIARCLLCLETKELTHEHLIPQAFGGRIKPKIYCRWCNTDLGNSVDAEFVNTFGHLATLLKIGRDRGQNRPYEVKDVQRGISLMHDGKMLSRKHPVVKATTKDGKIESVDITARSERELATIRKRITAKHGISELGETFEERHPAPIDTTYERRIDTRQIRRAVTKMAYGYLCTKIPASQIFGPAFARTRKFIKDNRGDDLASANFIHTKWMSDYARPLHRIHVSLNRARGIVVGYVMLFGIYKFSVLLSENFESFLEWSDLDYTFNPVTRKIIQGREEFLSPPITEHEILKPRQSKEFVRKEIIRSHKILNEYTEGVVFLDMELN